MTDKILDIDEKYRNFCSENSDKIIPIEEYYLLHILNEKNKLITKKFINNIFSKYGLNHKVNELQRFQKAFIHDSYLEKNISNIKYLRQIKDTEMILEKDKKNAMKLFNGDISYQRLEYLGDSVIHVAIAQYLEERFEEQDEGFLTKIRTRLENGRTEANFSRALGLPEYVIISRSIEQAGGRLNNYKISEDIFEAFIGALSKEITLDECVKFVINIIEKEADIVHMINNENNFKGVLMKECHAQKWDDVDYNTEDDEEAEILKLFTVKAICGDEVKKYIGYGQGKSKRQAQQKAAKSILIKMGKLVNESIEEDENDIYEVLNDNIDNNIEINNDEIYAILSEEDL